MLVLLTVIVSVGGLVIRSIRWPFSEKRYDSSLHLQSCSFSIVGPIIGVRIQRQMELRGWSSNCMMAEGSFRSRKQTSLIRAVRKWFFYRRTQLRLFSLENKANLGQVGIFSLTTYALYHPMWERASVVVYWERSRLKTCQCLPTMSMIYKQLFLPYSSLDSSTNTIAIMHLSIGYIAVILTLFGTSAMDVRIGPCPGIPLDSCECFQRLYASHVEIANMTDIVARNWRITLWYQDISHAFQKLLRIAPDSTPDLPAIGIWPSMAAWASNLVGFGIRQQSVPELWSYIIRNLPRWIQDLVGRLPPELIDKIFKNYLEHTATALAGGNLLVFREIASSYARYGMEFCNESTKPDDAKMTEFIQKYVCMDGSCDLGRGLWALFRAHYGSAASLTFAERDQFLLVQGMYVGLSEQTHLQPFINGSLPGYATNWCEHLPKVNVTDCRASLNVFATKLLVHLLIGSHRLLVDHDMPSGVHNGSDYSPFLANLTLPQAHDLMAQFLNSTDLSLNNTAASDWNSLAQRMRFVAVLFRVFQDHEEINCYMFSSEQELLIRTDQTKRLGPQSWLKICDRDCCATNGRWNGENHWMSLGYSSSLLLWFSLLSKWSMIRSI